MSKFHVHFHGLTAMQLQQVLTALTPIPNESQFAQLNTKLNQIIAQGEKLLMTETEALAIITQVRDVTTKIGVSVGAEGDTLQKINDEIDAIIAGQKGTIPQSVADALTAINAPIQAISDNLDTHQAILEGILAKGQPVIPPTPIPDPVPVPVV